MDTVKLIQHLCFECGNDVHQLPGRKQKKFCCTECRSKWFNRKRRAEAKIAPREEDARICLYCGKSYFTYGQNARKYCSHECYIAARFGNKTTAIDDLNGQSEKESFKTGTESMGTEVIARPERKEISREELLAYLDNPYVKKATEERIVPTESFFGAAYPLLEAGIDKTLSAFEMNPDSFSQHEKIYFTACMERTQYFPMCCNEVNVINDSAMRIMAARLSVMSGLVEEKLREIGTRFKGMAPPERKEICLMIHNFPKDPGGIFTISRILSLVGISRNSYYRYIGKDNYGLTVSARDALVVDDVRLAFEYKGYKKGVRMVYMLIPILTGRKIGLDRVRRIMREYGMDSGVRKASTSRKAAAERLAKYKKDNLLKRMFRLHRPNEVRITDVTYLK